MTLARAQTSPSYDLVVVGHGAAGLAAAVTAAVAGASVAVLEKTTEAEAGGNTRWTSAFMRAETPDVLAEGFEEDFHRFTGPEADGAYISALAEQAPSTLRWLESLGIQFELLPMFFVSSARPRLGVHGGGAEIIEVLKAEAARHGVHFRYEHDVTELLVDDGRVVGVEVGGASGATQIRARHVLLATGGFQGDPALVGRYLGEELADLPVIARGGRANTGAGITLTRSVGAALAGKVDGYHCEPVDPRSRQAEAINMLYPYGLLVNGYGDRFLDEASGTVDETYEQVTLQIAEQPGHLAYLIADQRIFSIPGWQRAVLTDRPPYQAEDIEGLGTLLGIDADTLADTVRGYNEFAHTPPEGPLDADPDGLATRAGLTPPKSNWAHALTEGPFVAWPLTAAVVFTFHGLKVDSAAQVLAEDGSAVPGLLAAGEATGIYHDKYPGATSVMRALTFGRIAGRVAASAASPAIP